MYIFVYFLVADLNKLDSLPYAYIKSLAKAQENTIILLLIEPNGPTTTIVCIHYRLQVGLEAVPRAVTSPRTFSDL